MYLIAEGFWLANPQNWLTVLQVALGLGFVIFVHELGHFAVAKMCGVKCEKFYLGFDIYGLKLFKKQWGETEYGIGVLPLGGYVKMLGQDDNPTRNAAEMERSRASGAAAAAAHSGGDLPAEPTAETPPVHDPRSYLAQSVPERMAIISAGVIMNLIFAVIMAAVAYGMGVPEEPAGASQVIPGEAGWQAGLRPGDQITRINEIDNPRFRDLMISVVLSNNPDGVEFTVKRKGVEEPFTVNIQPQLIEGRDRMTIGVLGPAIPVISTKSPLFPATVAGQLDQFQDGDRIVRINGQEIADYVDLQAALATNFDKALEVTVERAASSESESSPQQTTISVPTSPYRHLGLTMTMGPISAVQAGSPAETVGLKAGDKIVKINGQDPVDPMFLPQWLRRQASAGSAVEITVEREGASEPITVHADLRNAAWFETPTAAEGARISAPALGIAYPIGNTIVAVDPQGPAAGKFAPGDQIASAELLVDEKLKKIFKEPVLFEEESNNWVNFMAQLQMVPATTEVKLTTVSGKSETVTPVLSTEWFNPDRGLNFRPETQTRTAGSFGEAVQLGFRETVEQASQVLRFLSALVNQRLSPKNLGGPATIAVGAASFAEQGVPKLLIFLTMLSANLAVINFLPIPILDGGHMVFLTLEGIRGKPLSERVIILLTYVGFALVLGLMLFVIGLDVWRFALN